LRLLLVLPLLLSPRRRRRRCVARRGSVAVGLWRLLRLALVASMI